jgi:hypothetical protein
MEVLRLAAGGQDLALIARLKVSDELAGTTLGTVLGTLLASIRGLVLALASSPAATLGLPHAVLYVVRRVLRRSALAHLCRSVLIHLAFHPGGRWRWTLVRLHLGYILL